MLNKYSRVDLHVEKYMINKLNKLFQSKDIQVATIQIKKYNIISNPEASPEPLQSLTPFLPKGEHYPNL